MEQVPQLFSIGVKQTLTLREGHKLDLFLCLRVNTATSSPADDVHHYVILKNLLDSIFNNLPVFMRQWEKEKDVLYPVDVPSPVADSFHVATMA
jgi:hypothetical protein